MRTFFKHLFNWFSFSFSKVRFSFDIENWKYHHRRLWCLQFNLWYQWQFTRRPIYNSIEKLQIRFHPVFISKSPHQKTQADEVEERRGKISVVVQLKLFNRIILLAFSFWLSGLFLRKRIKRFPLVPQKLPQQLLNKMKQIRTIKWEKYLLFFSYFSHWDFRDFFEKLIMKLFQYFVRWFHAQPMREVELEPQKSDDKDFWANCHWRVIFSVHNSISQWSVGFKKIYFKNVVKEKISHKGWVVRIWKI